MTLRIIIAVALVGCGHGDAPSKADPKASADPATGTDKKPCEYMARADAEAAAGMPLPTTTEFVPLHSCSYASPDYFDVELIVREWEGFKDGMALDGQGHPMTAVPGVGDEAWWRANGNVYVRMYVRKGDRGLVVTVNSPTTQALEDKALARVKALALTIVPKI